MLDRSALHAIFFDALPKANEADFAAFAQPISSCLAKRMNAETLENHLVTDGMWLEADAKALVAKLQEKGVLS